MPPLWVATLDFQRRTSESNSYFLGRDLSLLFITMWPHVQLASKPNRTDPGISVSSNLCLFQLWLGKAFPWILLRICHH